MRTVAAFEAFGARIAVRGTEEIAGLSLQLPPASRATRFPGCPDCLYTIRPRIDSAGNDELVIFRDGDAVDSFETLDEVRFEIESDMHFRVARAARGFLFVHAGVVGHAGRAIVLPGPTHAGKSTLVLALVRAGAEYYSDEYAVIDREGMIYPYRKPLSERVGGQTRPRMHRPESLCRGGGTVALPLGAHRGHSIPAVGPVGARARHRWRSNGGALRQHRRR